MTIKSFASIKEKLKEDITLSDAQLSQIELKAILIEAEPSLMNILDRCRFVVNNQFVNQDFIFQSDDIVYIVPPSSGG
jgi:molybdopterin converting factor small subunit